MVNTLITKHIADKLTFDVDWVDVDQLRDVEGATAAGIQISLDAVTLTDAYDAFQEKVSSFAQLSAYRLAEWLAWNWWRLRWEPFKPSLDWRLSHNLASIGGGYVWPSISIYSDGLQLSVTARPTESRSAEPLRYVKNYSRELGPKGFENGVDKFIAAVLEHLKKKNLGETDLKTTWEDIQAERRDTKISAYRKFEAVLGFDPDQADPDVINKMLEDALVLGEGIQELAAASSGNPPPSKDEIFNLAERSGVKRDPRNAVKLLDKSDTSLPNNVEAWRRGKAAAKSLRRENGLGERPILTPKLLEMIGSSTSQLAKINADVPFSFEIDENVALSKFALRKTEFETNKRFDLARLIGDNVARTGAPGRLVPITSALTYRQKLQKAFAAEFLSPFYLIDGMIEGNYYDETRIEGVASHFGVSTLSIRTSLANHHRIEREDVWAD